MSVNSKIIITDNTHPYENKIKLKDLGLGAIFKFFNSADQKDHIYMKISNELYNAHDQKRIECTVFEISPTRQTAFSYIDGDCIILEVYDYEIILNKCILDKDK